MIIFDLLRVSDDGKQLLIDFHVNSSAVYEHIYLDNVTIVTSDKISETMPECATSEGFIYKKDYPSTEGGYVKSDTLVIDTTTLTAAQINWDPTKKEPINPDNPYADTSFDKSSFSQDLFFVYVHCVQVGTSECYELLPCHLKSLTTVGVVFDKNVFYQKVMDYTKTLADTCTIPQGFTDFILLWNGYNAAVNTGHYLKARDFYNLLVGSTSKSSHKSKCGCRS